MKELIIKNAFFKVNIKRPFFELENGLILCPYDKKNSNELEKECLYVNSNNKKDKYLILRMGTKYSILDYKKPWYKLK